MKARFRNAMRHNHIGEVRENAVVQKDLLDEVLAVLFLNCFDFGDVLVCAVRSALHELPKVRDGLLCRSRHLDSPV